MTKPSAAIVERYVLSYNSPAFEKAIGDVLAEVLEMDTQVNKEIFSLYCTVELEWFFNNGPIYVPVELDTIMRSESLPSFDFFRNLPNALDMDTGALSEIFLVYTMTLEKEGQKLRLYFGSGSAKREGAAARLRSYRNRDVSAMPLYVQKSLEEGWKITNVGASVMMEIPADVVLLPRLRAWILMLEAAFTWMFWSVKGGPATDDGTHYMLSVCSWNVADLEWDGLNTHSSMADVIVSIDLSSEQLITAEEFKETRKREYNKAWAAANPGYFREASAKYRQTEHGKNYTKEYGKAYQQTENDIARRKRHQQSDHGKAAFKLYRQTEAGKAVLKTYNSPEKGRATTKRYRDKKRARR